MIRLCTLGIILLAAQLATPALNTPATAQSECSPFDKRPLLATTRIGPHKDIRLFVAGDFKPVTQKKTSQNEEDEILDFAFVSTTETMAGPQNVLSVMISSDGGCFTQPVPSNVLAGDDPILIAAGRINDDDRDDVVIVDGHTDPFNVPKLRIFLRGINEGEFTSTTIPLKRGERPVALALGLFREPKAPATKDVKPPKKPLDVAIVSAAAGRSVLRLFFNNGKGGFDTSPLPIGDFPDFEPANMMASDTLRDGGNTDLVIKEATVSGSKRRVLYLKNAGNGTFPDVFPLVGAGELPWFQLGKFRPDTAGDNLDIITFDEDMTVKIFKNLGLGIFRPPSEKLETIFNRWNSTNEFQFAPGIEPRFLVADFNDKQLRLKAVATQDIQGRRQQGVLTLAFDNGAIQSPHFAEIPPLAIATPGGDSDKRESETVTASRPRSPVLNVIGGIVARFTSALSGSKGPVFGLVGRHVLTETNESACATDGPMVGKTKSTPPPMKKMPLVVKSKSKPARRCNGGAPRCEDGLAHPVPPICSGTFSVPCDCVCPPDTPEDKIPEKTPGKIPRDFCETSTGFPVLLVFDN
jgi:hypothetical protein